MTACLFIFMCDHKDPLVHTVHGIRVAFFCMDNFFFFLQCVNKGVGCVLELKWDLFKKNFFFLVFRVSRRRCKVA